MDSSTQPRLDQLGQSNKPGTPSPQLQASFTPSPESLGNPAPRLHPTAIQFAGRIGGNQEFVANRADPASSALLHQTPDAAPGLSFGEALSLRGFAQPALWKAAVIEGMGTLGLDYVTMMIALSPSIGTAPLPKPDPISGPFGTTLFLGPAVGAVTNVVIISLYISAFGPVTGGHVNPLITMATFFARLTSLPRAVLYISFQLLGAALAGLLARASYGSTDFKIGGCFRDPALVTTQQAFTIEFTMAFALLFIAFGVGLDPRQASVFPTALPPILVGFAVGAFSLATTFMVPGYGGAGLNPARCFAAYVGSAGAMGVVRTSGDGKHTAVDGSWHWVHWIGPLAASVLHAVF